MIELAAHKRLAEARQKAGYPDATAAARAFGWNENTYRSHENGQRGLKIGSVKSYAAAFNVEPGWLALGENRATGETDAEEGKDHRIPVMMTSAEVIAIDDWGFANRVRSRSEAIRRLCAIGLSAKKVGAP